MQTSKASLVRAGRVLLLVLGACLVHQTPASAQYLGYGGMGYGGMGYGGMGYGGMGYGGLGYGGMGYGGLGYGGLGYGGFGYGGFGGYGFGFEPGYANALGLMNAGSYQTGYSGIGYPGISWRNPYFSFGLSPLAVNNAIFERQVLGRTTPPLQSSLRRSAPIAAPRPTVPSGAVGTGTFGN